jgi:biotin transporter BioY
MAALAEIVALIFVAGYLLALWQGGLLLQRLQRDGRAYVVVLIVIVGALSAIALGYAAGMFLANTHSGGAPNGMSYIWAVLAYFGPLLLGPITLFTWVSMLRTRAANDGK